jgi:hypothetical protein
MGHKPGNIGLGNLTGLRPINATTTINQSDNDDDYVEDDSTTNNTTYCTKIMRITPEIFEKLREFSHKYHNQPISYDEIIDELCTFYNEQHKPKSF